MKACWMATRLLFCLPYMVAAQPTSLEFDATAPSALQLDQYLQRKHSALAGSGQRLVDLGRQYGIDPRLPAAIAGAETTFGKHVCAPFNAWNWFYRRDCESSEFASYDEGMTRVTKFLRLSYVNKGYNTVELVRLKYCARGCDNWIPLVNQFRAEMPSSPAPSPTPVPAPVSSTRMPSGIHLFGLPRSFFFGTAAVLVAGWLFSRLRQSGR